MFHVKFMFASCLTLKVTQIVQIGPAFPPKLSRWHVKNEPFQRKLWGSVSKMTCTVGKTLKWPEAGQHKQVQFNFVRNTVRCCGTPARTIARLFQLSHSCAFVDKALPCDDPTQISRSRNRSMGKFISPRHVSGRAWRLTRCRMVGRPWGQFQGCSSSLMWLTTVRICCALSAVPIMMDFLHARDANIIRTREGLKKNNRSSPSWLHCAVICHMVTDNLSQYGSAAFARMVKWKCVLDVMKGSLDDFTSAVRLRVNSTHLNDQEANQNFRDCSKLECKGREQVAHLKNSLLKIPQYQSFHGFLTCRELPAGHWAWRLVLLCHLYQTPTFCSQGVWSNALDV